MQACHILFRNFWPEKLRQLFWPNQKLKYWIMINWCINYWYASSSRHQLSKYNYIIHDYMYMYKIIMIYRSESYKKYLLHHKQILSSITRMKCHIYWVYQIIDTKDRITQTNLIKHLVYSFAILRIAQNWYKRSKIAWNK